MIAAVLMLAALAPDPVSGVWEGASTCQVHPSPCHDEHVIYRISKTASRHYRIDGYRLAAGKEVFMGPIDVTFEPASSLHGTVDTSRGPSEVRLTLKADHLSGRMTLADGTLFRLIELGRR
jgi:hypothetical protein